MTTLGREIQKVTSQSVFPVKSLIYNVYKKINWKLNVKSAIFCTVLFYYTNLNSMIVLFLHIFVTFLTCFLVYAKQYLASEKHCLNPLQMGLLASCKMNILCPGSRGGHIQLTRDQQRACTSASLSSWSNVCNTVVPKVGVRKNIYCLR